MQKRVECEHIMISRSDYLLSYVMFFSHTGLLPLPCLPDEGVLCGSETYRNDVRQ